MWSIVLTGGTTLLQAQKKGGASHSAPATHQHSAAPQKQEHTPTPMHERPSPTLEHPAPHSQGRTFGNHPPQTPRVPNPPARQNHLNPAPAHSGGTEKANSHRWSSGGAAEVRPGLSEAGWPVQNLMLLDRPSNSARSTLASRTALRRRSKTKCL
jgi:hypothetical protein